MLDDSDEDVADSSADAESEGELASIIAYLLRSGSAQLVHSTNLNGPASILAQSSTWDDDDDVVDDDSDEDYHYNGRYPKPPSPQADLNPDTTKLEASNLKGALSNGSTLKGSTNTSRRLAEREHHMLPRPHFSQGDKVLLGQRFLPNTMKPIAKFREKAFCGVYSEDGDIFLSACQDQHIRLYDTTNGKFELFRDIVARDVGWSVVDTAYSPDQNYLIYSSWSESIHLCNIYGDYETHVALDLRPGDIRFCAFSIEFSKNSKEILAGGSDQCMYIYDRERDQRTLRFKSHDDDVNAVAFADASSQILFSASDDGLCRVWDRRSLSEENPKPVGTLAGHTDGLTFIDSKGDGRHLITNSKDQSIKLWDIRCFASGETIKESQRIVANQNWDYRWEISPRRSQRLKAVPGDPSLMTYLGHSVMHTLLRARFSPEVTTGQKYICAACSTGSVVIYDILTGHIITKLKGHRQSVRDVSWHPYQSIIMSSSWDCTVGRWTYSRLETDEFCTTATPQDRWKKDSQTVPRPNLAGASFL